MMQPKKVLVAFTGFILATLIILVVITVVIQNGGLGRRITTADMGKTFRQTIVSQISAKGTVDFIHTDIVYPQTEAKVKKINTREGNTVIIGDLLLEYDDKPMEALRDQLAEAQLSLKSAQINLQTAQLPAPQAEKIQAEVNVNQAKQATKTLQSQIDQLDMTIAQLKRNRDSARKKVDDVGILLNRGVISQSEFDTQNENVQKITDEIESAQAKKNTLLLELPAMEETLMVAQEQYGSIVNRVSDPKVQNEICALQVAVAQAELKVRQIEKRMEDFKSREFSAFSGTVLRVNAIEGDMSISGKPLFEIADVSNRNLVIKICVSEEDSKNLDIGQEAHIKGAALGTEIYKGRVSKIYPLAEKKQSGDASQITAEITPMDENIKLRAGYSIDTDIITKITIDAVVVPLSAIVTETDGNHYVYVYRRDHSVEKRQVTIGITSGEYAQADELMEGETIILNPSRQIIESTH